MSTKQQRGTKRTCQSSECGSRFYDLARNPIVCPVCGSNYVIASSPGATAAAMSDDKRAAKAKKPEFVAKEIAPDLAEDAVAEEALAEIEGGDETEIAAEDDETFLVPEEEAEGGDVSNIIGGPVQEGGEET